MYEAIGLIETKSLAFGLDSADAMIKAAPVEFVDTYMVTPGKYVVLVHGDPSSVESSLAAGRLRAADQLLDSLLIPFVDASVLPAIRGEPEIGEIESLGFLETSSIASGIHAADSAVKAADIELLRLHLAKGIGGKSILTLSGSLHAVEAALEAGCETIREQKTLVAQRIIANPHPDLLSRLSQPGTTSIV